MKIRKSKPEEYKEYISLRRESMDYLMKISGEKFKISDKKIKDEFLLPKKDKSNKINFIEDNKKIIGYLNFTLFENNGKKSIYLNDFTISKENRKQGYGKKAMKWLINFSKDKKYDRIGLGTRFENKIARKMYEKLGFKVVGINYGMILK